MDSLQHRMEQDGYDGYAYSYPHKTAYRPLNPPVPLQQAWKEEDTSKLLLYVHLPFCEMRCGFCNLFTTVRPGGELVEQTLQATARQSKQVRQAISPRQVVQMAIGGGTPSYLSLPQLEQLFQMLQADWPIDLQRIPVSFEASPATLTVEKLTWLRQQGVSRLSLGVQSFVDEDLYQLHRPQKLQEVERACHMILETGFAIFNIDLIYGNPEQTPENWLKSLEQALRWKPQELYLYPLYVGPLTGLDRLGRRPGQRRRGLYKLARERLLAAGYVQLSMRHFRAPGVDFSGDYCCQEDGCVGLGPGARSYTQRLHYSSEYAVSQPGVRGIIANFNQRPDQEFAHADYGVWLDQQEQKLRKVIKTLLRAQGCPAGLEIPQLKELQQLGLALPDPWRLTEEGLAWSDTIGPWLYSPQVHQKMQQYQHQ